MSHQCKGQDSDAGPSEVPTTAAVRRRVVDRRTRVEVAEEGGHPHVGPKDASRPAKEPHAAEDGVEHGHHLVGERGVSDGTVGHHVRSREQRG